MDGARLMNACVAAGVPAREMAAGFESVWLDFTKGLGAPLGAVLCGSSEFIGQRLALEAAARRLDAPGRDLAAACLYALDHNIDRLAEDHANAKALARGLAQIPGIEVEAPDTNLVFFDTAAPGSTSRRCRPSCGCRACGLRLGGRVRACTHLDVTAPMIEEAVEIIREAITTH